MSNLTHTARSARAQDGFIVVVMESGPELRFPVAENARRLVCTGLTWMQIFRFAELPKETTANV